MVVSSTALVGLLDKKGCLYSQVTLILMAIIGLIFALCVKEDLKRLKYEQQIACSSNEEKPLITKTDTSNGILSCQETQHQLSEGSQVDSNKYRFTTESNK